MPFIILGAGAIGCYIGGRLASAGYQTVLVGRPHTLGALSHNGLRVSDPDGFDAQIKPDQLQLCSSLHEALAGLDAKAGAPTIFVCVKGTGTDAIAKEIAQYSSTGTVIISLQNGLESAQRIRAAAPQVNVHAGMVPYTVMWRKDHNVHRANGGVLQVQSSNDTQALVAIMAAAGVPWELQDNMPGIQWGKLLINLLNPVNALADIPIREQLLQRDFRLVFAALQTEALGVLKAANIQPSKVAAVAPAVVPRVLSLPNWLFTRVAAGMLNTDQGAKTSMCVDLRNDRPTEIDDLCGAVVRLAEAHGTYAPLNATMVDLVTHFQAGKTWTGPELRRALQI